MHTIQHRWYCLPYRALCHFLIAGPAYWPVACLDIAYADEVGVTHLQVRCVPYVRPVQRCSIYFLLMAGLQLAWSIFSSTKLQLA